VTPSRFLNALLNVVYVGVLLVSLLLLSRQFIPRKGKVLSPIRNIQNGSVLDLGRIPMLGSPNAPLIVVEFSDYECPFCKRHANEVFRMLAQQFVSTGQLRYGFANFPLSDHIHARPLAYAAICAGDQGLYWEMHDQLFRSNAGEVQLSGLVSTLRINSEDFMTCTRNVVALEKVIADDIRLGQSVGVNGTPGFAFARQDSSGRAILKKVVLGAQPFDVFKSAIKELSSDGS
jgi:protein-disulfide isomerase